MKNQLSLPEEIEPGPHHSWRSEMKINGWAWLAVLTGFAGELFLLPRHPHWPAAWRLTVALTPLVTGLFWVRSLMRWMRGMDELQHRVTTASVVFATTVTLFVVVASHLLVIAGILPARFEASASFVIIWLVVCFYILGRAVFKHRYQ